MPISSFGAAHVAAALAVPREPALSGCTGPG